MKWCLILLLFTYKVGTPVMWEITPPEYLKMVCWPYGEYVKLSKDKKWIKCKHKQIQTHFYYHPFSY